MKGHQARRRFGQNFLADPHYVKRIVDAVDPQPGDNLVEIGPGLAALTGDLIARAGRIAAVEIDRDLAARLCAQFTPAQLALHEDDALEFDFLQLGPRLRVVGNLPYNISTPLLFRLAAHDAQLRDVHVMLQREVVARMTADPDTADYGRLTVMLQAKFRIVRLFVVPGGAFRPAPKVESALARLSPLHERKPEIVDEATFACVVAAAFAQRRKTLRNALSSLASAATLEAAGIDPGVRGETLAVADFVRLANTLQARSLGT
jgi:16S rRNA (adenine1518-N6/adenine1519-N6)-dimethyltransferase